ncbi:hypothetical protein BDW67DRAFT_160989 [Aspergillus spinulosporus]
MVCCPPKLPMGQAATKTRSEGLTFPQILITLISAGVCSPHRCRGKPPTSTSWPRPDSKVLLRGGTAFSDLGVGNRGYRISRF